MFNKNLKIYVTGGSGLVGRNLIENSHLSKCNIIAPAHSELDLLNYDNVYTFVNKEKPDLIIHTAGQVGGIAANMADPYGFFSNNIIMGVNIVKAAKETGVKNLLNLSSSCSYPCNAINPLSEDMVLTGSFEKTNEGYAIAKTAILRMCEYLTNQFEGYHYKTLIPCNLYGRYDKFSPKNSHLIPAIIRKLEDAKKNNISIVDIWGDGESRREFMYAGDFAEIVVKIIEQLEEMPITMNIGLGYDYTINEYYDKVAKVVGFKGKFIHDLTKPSGMKQKLLDISLQKSLGLDYNHSLENGIKKTYEYYLNEYRGE